MTAAEEPSCSIYLSNVHESLSDERLEHVLQRAGRVLSLRLMEPQRRGAAPNTRVGFCDFADNAAAVAAVSIINGFLCPDGSKISAKLSERKRNRDEQEDDHSKEFVFGSSLAGPGDPIQVALSGIPVPELYEAVEQLRVMALERPAAARQLLAANPQLRYAVTIVLQHAERVPLVLPRGAVLGDAPVAPSQPVADTPVATAGSAGQSMQEAAVAAVQELSEVELQRLLGLTEEDFSQQDPATAAHLRALQGEILKLLGS
uniref:RRM domain-containing protein n=1 Tax=Neobodo designis TaxID=312471 RepID=A0A6U4S9Z7_NEODS|mmetsp:Transcript_30729/g.94947  ORF Transcript_30729/g.94947 Transcript_30729/m.94947 type:complete len:260 (+) Transcript_30729:29-808(+)